MTKLNQIIAIEKGIKNKVTADISEIYKIIQKPELFMGFSKTYRKINEESEDLPAERKKVTVTAKSALFTLFSSINEVLTVTARKDWTNAHAYAQVKIGDEFLLEKVPVTYLLFLEKQLTDMKTFISKLPELDNTEDWESVGDNISKTKTISTHRTKKITRPIVKYDATEHHPAQTELISEDILAGYWDTIKVSGGMPPEEKKRIWAKVEVLLQTVKEARETANETQEVSSPEVGKTIFNYLLKDK